QCFGTERAGGRVSRQELLDTPGGESLDYDDFIGTRFKFGFGRPPRRGWPIRAKGGIDSTTERAGGIDGFQLVGRRSKTDARGQQPRSVARGRGAYDKFGRLRTGPDELEQRCNPDLA